jgi:hypothetical protein
MGAITYEEQNEVQKTGDIEMVCINIRTIFKRGALCTIFMA